MERAASFMNTSEPVISGQTPHKYGWLIDGRNCVLKAGLMAGHPVAPR